jgi:hypothetical protein
MVDWLRIERRSPLTTHTTGAIDELQPDRQPRAGLAARQLMPTSDGQVYEWGKHSASTWTYQTVLQSLSRGLRGLMVMASQRVLLPLHTLYYY